MHRNRETEPAHGNGVDARAMNRSNAPAASGGVVAGVVAGVFEGFLSPLLHHARHDGVGVALAWLVRCAAARVRPRARDPGERAAERFLRALGYSIEARNWRSPRDPRDEADLLAVSPDGRAFVIVEVKRSAGPWDALERVDTRKKEVLWRLLRDLEDAAMGEAASRARGHAFPRALRTASSIRVDLVGVRGEGSKASATRHVVGLFERPVRRPRGMHGGPAG